MYLPFYPPWLLTLYCLAILILVVGLVFGVLALRQPWFRRQSFARLFFISSFLVQLLWALEDAIYASGDQTWSGFPNHIVEFGARLIYALGSILAYKFIPELPSTAAGCVFCPCLEIVSVLGSLYVSSADWRSSMGWGVDALSRVNMILDMVHAGALVVHIVWGGVLLVVLFRGSKETGRVVPTPLVATNLTSEERQLVASRWA